MMTASDSLIAVFSISEILLFVGASFAHLMYSREWTVCIHRMVFGLL